MAWVDLLPRASAVWEEHWEEDFARAADCVAAAAASAAGAHWSKRVELQRSGVPFTAPAAGRRTRPTAGGCVTARSRSAEAKRRRTLKRVGPCRECVLQAAKRQHMPSLNCQRAQRPVDQSQSAGIGSTRALREATARRAGGTWHIYYLGMMTNHPIRLTIRTYLVKRKCAWSQSLSRATSTHDGRELSGEENEEAKIFFLVGPRSGFPDDRTRRVPDPVTLHTRYTARAYCPRYRN